MAKPTAQLTIANITEAQRAVASGAKQRVELRDGAVPGLRLRAGRRAAVWDVVAETKDGRVTFPLGSYPTVSLAQARILARGKKDALTEVGAAAIAGNKTLDALLDEYEDGPARQKRTWKKIRSVIKLVFASALDERLIKLDRLQLQLMIDRYQSASVAGYAVRVFRPILRWGRRRGMLTFNPDELEPPVEKRQPRDRVLSDDELSSVLSVLGSSVYDVVTRLLMLTACRRSEVASAYWSELDFKKMLWTIPRERTKPGMTRIIPLTDEMAELFKSQPKTDVMVFGRLDNWHRYQQELYMRTGTRAWHRHDLRRTSATVLGRLGFEPHVIEAVLGHKAIYSRLAATYNHHRYEKEHREALEALSKFYASL